MLLWYSKEQRSGRNAFSELQGALEGSMDTTQLFDADLVESAKELERFDLDSNTSKAY